MTKPAESAVEALESLPFGEPWREAFNVAAAALATEYAATDAEVFPLTIEPTTADAIAEYTWHTNRLGAVGYGAALAALHERAHAGLRALLRSREAIEDVGAAAARYAAPASNQETHAAAEQRAAHLAVQAYKAVIAHQLAAEMPAAQRLVDLETLSARLDAARQRHEHHAAAELERHDAERRAAARVVVDRTAEKVREAEAVARDLLMRAQVSANEYRRVKAEALIERLKLSGLTDLRTHDGEIYGVADLIAAMPRMSIEQLNRFEYSIGGQS